MTLSSAVQRASLSILLLTFAQCTRALAQDATSDKPSTNIATGTSSPTALQSSTSTSSSSTQTHTIQVGLADHKMRPETIEAAVGDIVEFDFYPLNHSVVRAEYGFPCIPYDMTGSDKTGFFSGFRPVDKVLDSPPKYSVRINDTEPIFYYCSAPGSCITYGMVGGINLNSSMSVDKQRTLAMDSAYMLQPGEPFPAESPLPSGNPASSLSPSASSTSTSAPAAGHSPPGGLSTGAIVGIVIAAVCAVLFGALLFFCWGRTKSLREAIERRDGTVRRISASPNQMVEYKTQDQHVQPHHAHSASQAGYQFPHHSSVHNGSHPGSPELGAYTYQHQHQNSVSTGYFPANYPTKYTSPASTHPAYHSMSPGTPPPLASHNNHLVGQMYGHHTPPAVPTYYETFPNLSLSQDPRQVPVPVPVSVPAQEQRPVEMEAITAADPDVAGERGETVRASKF